MITVAFGVTRMLDGLEVMIVGAMGGVLQSSQMLHPSSGGVGLLASCYVAGTVSGALVFG